MTAVRVPSNAGASVTVPDAPCTPWTPSGRSSVVSARVTPEVPSSFCWAVSSTVCGSPRSEADLEHAVVPKVRATATTTQDQRCTDMEITLSQAGSQLSRHGTRTGDDRLGARGAAAVAAADRLGQVDRGPAGGRRACGRRPRPGEDEGVLALEEPVAADATGGA